MKIAIIGGGNLGASIAEGLAQTDLVKASDITVTRRNLAHIAHLQKLGIETISNNLQAAKYANVIIVAVKPYQIKAVLAEIAPSLSANDIVISVVTGVSLAEMRAAVAKDVTLFRAMPNTAIAIQQSMTCIATNSASEEEKQLVLDLFERLGKAIILDEELMQASTVLAACGIAYAMRFIRAASQGGIEIGFGADAAQFIAAQTVKGAASLLLERGLHPESEIDKVTTPQGCTIIGLNEMEHQGFSSALIKGVRTSYDKIADIRG